MQHFVVKKFGSSQWVNLLEQCKLKGKLYLPTQVYPDSEIVELVTTASEITNIPASVLLEEFGAYIAPSLMKIYSASIKPEWTTIDLLEHVENTIHKAVRFADKTATPPNLVCQRKSKKAVSIDYSSKRNMVDVGIGIIKSIANLKQEKVNVSRHDMAGATRLEVELVS